MIAKEGEARSMANGSNSGGGAVGQLADWSANPDDPIAVLAPPTLLSTALGALSRRRGIRSVADLAALDMAEARRIKGIGRAKIEALKELRERARTVCPPTPALVEDSPTALASVASEEPSPTQLGKLFVAARLVFGASTLAELGSVPWGELLALVELEDDGPDTDLRALAPRSFQFFDVTRSVLGALDEVGERARYILERAVFATKSECLTLSTLGGELSLSRERVRQIRVRALRQFDDVTSPVLRPVAPWLRYLAGECCRIKTLHECWASFVDLAPEEARPVVIAALSRAAGYTLGADGWAVTSAASTALRGARERLRSASRATGVVPAASIAEILGGHLKLPAERDAYLESELGLVRFEGAWIPGGSVRARVVASLSIIGAPATKAEIAEMAGATPARVSSYLSSVPGVCRADKERWAFEEWVDDPYDGIVGEILQRLEEDGGVTTVERLLTELPATFGVSELSVRSYLATPRFVVRSGMVRLATDAEVASTYYGSVEDVPSAVRLEGGEWAVKIHVEDRFFSGYSAGFPLPVAQAVGIRPGESLVVPVAGTPHSVSLIWRIDNTSRIADLGRLAPVLEHLGIEAGEDLVVAPGRTEVRIYRDGDAPVARGNRQTTPDVVVDSILDDLFSR